MIQKVADFRQLPDAQPAADGDALQSFYGLTAKAQCIIMDL
jgi:hypothetical protein